ncbi:ISL3 family transposase, partial [Streptomyces asiaticus]
MRSSLRADDFMATRIFRTPLCRALRAPRSTGNSSPAPCGNPQVSPSGPCRGTPRRRDRRVFRSGAGTRDRFGSVLPTVASKTVEDVLFPGLGVRVERVSDSSGALVVEAVGTGRPGRCPDCRKQARRVHSSCQRSLDERPLGSRRVVVRLRVRRYFCDRRKCSRKTFVEQVPGLTERHRRSSTVLTGWLRSIAIEFGGRPAARLCRRLPLAAGRTRLLGLLTAPAVPDRAPRVLGVDEFAFRKGCAYGTVLVDVEAGRVVDVLPDRTSETFAAWLTEHPGAEIICRDRATAYTKAVKEAAPNAVEVADRWQCAMRRLVVFPIQSGRIWREVLGSDGLPNPETVMGPQHARKST